MLQHEHGNVCEAKLTGEEQADRAGTGDYDVVDHEDSPLASRSAKREKQ